MTAPTELNPYQADVIECPYPMYERMREQGVYYLESAGAWIVTRWEDVQFVLKRSDLFSNLPGLDPHALAPEQMQLARETGALPGSDPPEHTHYRRLAGPWLSKRGIDSFEPQVYRVIDSLIDRFIEDGEVELASQFSTPMTVLVFVELMGIGDEDIPRVTSWVNDTIEAMGAAFGLVERERLGELMASGEAFRHYLLDLADERRGNPRDDMLTDLVTGSMKGFGGRTLHERELQGMLVTLLMGGTETTLNMVDSGMWLLLEHPDLLAELRADHSLIPNFVEEAPAHRVARATAVAAGGCRYRDRGRCRTRGVAHLNLLRGCQPRLLPLGRPRHVRHPPRGSEAPRGFRGGGALLHRRAAGADGGAYRLRAAADAPDEHPLQPRQERLSPRPEPRPPRLPRTLAGVRQGVATRTGACALQSSHGIDAAYEAEGACSRPAGDPPGG